MKNETKNEIFKIIFKIFIVLNGRMYKEYPKTRTFRKSEYH